MDTAFLAPTGVKTSAYTAQDGDFVPVDTTSGAVTVSLPSPVRDRAIIEVKLVRGGGAVTVAAGGSDTFNDGGGASLTISTLNQGVIVQYAETIGVWYALAGDVAGGGGGVTLDTTSTDIQPLGTQAAGSSGKAADAKHVHPMPSLDQVAAPAADVAWASHKLTGLANGSAAGDAVAYGQLGTAAFQPSSAFDAAGAAAASTAFFLRIHAV